MKNILYLLVTVLATTHFSNAQLNDYKYMVVPKRFNMFKEVNQYQTSTLVKHLFSTNGYTVIYDDVLPEDLKDNGCLALRAELDNNSSLFATKVSIVLKDCNGQIVFTSLEGRSKIKEFKPGYTDAIKKAFVSFETLNYEYVPKKNTKEESITISFKNDVKSLDEKTVEQKSKAKVNEDIIAMNGKNEESLVSGMEDKVTSQQSLEVLYAQAITDGYQLVDSTPKIQYKLTRTSVENIFLAIHEDKNGVVLKKDGKWFFEYAKNGEKVLEELNIKF